MRVWEKIGAVIEELEKYPELHLSDIIRLIERKLLVGEGTAKQYFRMMVRHELLEHKGNYIFSVKKAEEKKPEQEEKKSE